jgi:hypothetical protein
MKDKEFTLSLSFSFVEIKLYIINVNRLHSKLVNPLEIIKELLMEDY